MDTCAVVESKPVEVRNLSLDDEELSFMRQSGGSQMSLLGSGTNCLSSSSHVQPGVKGGSGLYNVLNFGIFMLFSAALGSSS